MRVRSGAGRAPSAALGDHTVVDASVPLAVAVGRAGHDDLQRARRSGDDPAPTNPATHSSLRNSAMSGLLHLRSQPSQIPTDPARSQLVRTRATRRRNRARARPTASPAATSAPVRTYSSHGNVSREQVVGHAHPVAVGIDLRAVRVARCDAARGPPTSTKVVGGVIWRASGPPAAASCSMRSAYGSPPPSARRRHAGPGNDGTRSLSSRASPAATARPSGNCAGSPAASNAGPRSRARGR